MATRLDKWLWAARFFKTRSLSKTAIEGGKVHWNGQKPKVGKDVHIGDLYTIRQGFEEKTVRVMELSEVRRGAPEAQKLYEETAESIKIREKNHEQRSMQGPTGPDSRPSKKDRRQIIRFKTSS